MALFYGDLAPDWPVKSVSEKGGPDSLDPPEFTASEKGAMLRTVVNLFGKWKLSDEDACKILGGMDFRIYGQLKNGDLGDINQDIATRLSLLLGIHKGLRLLFSDPERGYGWVKRENSFFDGKTPLDIMMAGDINSLVRVRSFLDGECNGW